VIFEAWFNGRPVVVNGRCDATRIAVERANGGWPGDDENWVNEIRQLESLSLEQLNVFGESGKAYSEANVTWEAAISNTISALIEQPKPPESVHSQRILQLLPNLSFGDAISNEAIFLDQEFRSRGYESFILVRGEHIDPRVSGFCEVFEDFVVSTQDCLIYHHSIGSEITPFVEDFGGTKCMIYHNITPPQFFARSRPEFARLLRDGLEQLWNLAGTIPISFVDSDFNGADLERFGFASPITLPLPVDPGVWDCKPSRALVEKYADGLKNIVFVGRYSPNKRQVELIRVLAWLCERSPNYRLILAGFGVESDPYLQEIRAEIAEFNLDDKVVLTGHITQEELHAVYRCADLFLCLSQHEGFGVPLLEAMWFDIPVVAIRHAAVAETLQGAGIVLDGDCSLNEVASIVSKVLEDNSLRDDVIRTQRDRRVLNLPENLHNSIDELLQVLISK
jgi:glycosyltransferase involved in cell wall biosynthesis